jgi:pyruvate ferredoxin oxidoreductase gamma subunit
MGAPVMAFCRISDKEIRLREPVLEPDCLIIQDPTLLHQVDLFKGLNPNGYILINSTRGFDELGLGDFIKDFPHHHLLTVGATELAIKHLGRPMPNAVLLGGFAATTGKLSLDAVVKAIHEKFPGAVGEKNVAAATEAYELVKKEKEEARHHA